MRTTETTCCGVVVLRITGASSRYAPMDEAVVLQKAATWANWVRDGNRVVTRDETRVREALRLLANEGNTEPYPVAVRKAHALGGKELTVMIALAVGKSAFRDMRQELRRRLPEVLMKQGCHRSTWIQKYVRKVERRVSPGGRSTENEESSDCSETASVATGARAPSNEPQALSSSNPTSPIMLQPQDRTGEIG